MKIYIKGFVPDEKIFAGSIGTKVAELNDEMIDELRMRATLERFGRELLAMYGKRARGERKVVGVDIIGIDFTLILDPKERE